MNVSLFVANYYFILNANSNANIVPTTTCKFAACNGPGHLVSLLARANVGFPEISNLASKAKMLGCLLDLVN